MLPFAASMVLAPRLTSSFASHFSGRMLWTLDLAVTFVGNLIFWVVARAQLTYGVFVMAMLVAGCGAGLLNGQAVKVLGGAVPQDRAGMASGLASTTRFIGILIGVAGMRAVLSHVMRYVFGAAAMMAGLDQNASVAAASASFPVI